MPIKLPEADYSLCNPCYGESLLTPQLSGLFFVVREQEHQEINIIMLLIHETAQIIESFA